MVDDDWLATLRRFRREYHLTQRELAVFLGVNQKTVSRWERGTDHPSPETRERLRTLLEAGSLDRLPAVYEAVREAPIPIALVDNNGTVLVASRFYAPPGGEAARSEAVRPAGEGGNLPTVLVIEDDAAVLKATRAVLKRWHFLSVGVPDGEAALRMVAEGGVTPDAAIIDQLLPGAMDGVDTANALRRAVPGLPVLIVSGASDPAHAAKIAASDLPLIRKPVDPEQVRTALLALLPAAAPFNGQE